jgi:two-component system, cell cycle sensor histidine kinase and response regulator CckA
MTPDDLGLYLSAFNQAPLGITVSTPFEARYVAVNDTFLRWFGLERGKVVGKTCLEVGPRMDPVDAWALSERVARRDPSPYELFVTSPDETRYWVSHWMHFVEIGGQPLILSYIQDCTARKKTEEATRHALRMEAVDRLSGAIAHDFGNALQAVVGHSDLVLRMLPPDARERRHVEAIERSALRATTLTQRLRAFSHRETVRPKTVLDGRELVSGLSEILRLLPPDIEIATELGDVAIPIRGDRDALDLALTNLVLNARDAMPDGGTLTLSTRHVVLRREQAEAMALAPGDYLCLEVKDSGQGMDEATRQRVFEPFFTTKPRGKGTGLGLATVAEVITQLGGHIGVTSSPGCGSTFALHLPISPEPIEPRHRSPVVPLPRGSETVMLVEDTDEVRDFTEHVLTSCGYSVIVARDPREALTKDVNAVDLLVCDVEMPQMPGPALAERLVSARPQLKTIFISAYPSDLLPGERNLRLGHNFLAKPFSVSSLAHRVRSVLDGAGAIAGD